MARNKLAKARYDRARYLSTKEHKIASAKQWYQDNKPRKQAYDIERRPIKNALRRDDYAVHPEKYHTTRQQRRSNTLRRYNMTTAEFDVLFESQGCCCACCKTIVLKGNKGWCVDHDHVTGKVRGILCGLCNTGLGALGDDVAGILKALEYLKRHYDKEHS